ncbi:major facilitator superfamily domain-containing protein [Polychytrium aggregatum]|uniref:major facilitator superfamily domain-containing protein n=1 Tax=Polychytrium aggregatum TaxID=110093 RepID=UPI0022FE154B|nr:major facilitator superfamily domain-containing protein [Polychytrium aggregatum]KAI9203368.1 major facilitator superfamily domain-containing protein [Polychytrium aggregatum]
METIGMGRYQWFIFACCGIGWLADNMWIQGIAVILPAVQAEFSVSDTWIGVTISFLFIGMMIGGLLWGLVSDHFGRRPAFIYTLLLGSVFGILCAVTGSFTALLFCILGLGIGVGGNLPVDGALFLEFIPSSRQNLLTLLSCFWPIGQVVASLLGWIFIPRYSCASSAPCDSSRNFGWRLVMAGLGLVSTSFLSLRFLGTRGGLLESPKFLINKQRFKDAVQVVESLSAANGSEIRPLIQPWIDHTLELEHVADASHDLEQAAVSDPPALSRMSAQIRQAYSDSLTHIRELFSHDMALTTTLVWLIWSLISVGYTMFNGFLPKYLGNSGEPNNPISVDEIYRNYVITSIFGIPGSIIAMYTINGSFGRRGTMAVATFGTAASMFLFTLSREPTMQLAASCCTSLLQNVMYGVLYAYTPEVFVSKYRGTATGIAAALGRITGTMAPLLTGQLLRHSLFAPLYVGAAILTAAGVCMARLPIETRGRAAR